MLENSDATLKRLRKALHRAPRDVSLHGAAVTVYEALGQYADAVPHIEYVIRHSAAPEEPVYIRYIRALQRAGAIAKSLTQAEIALQRYPHSRELLTLKALGHTLANDIPAACRLYSDLHTSNPQDRDSIGMCGNLKFLTTDMKEGHSEYALRPLNATNLQLLERRSRWSGEPLAGKHVFLWPEQGIGDIIMFIGLLPWILKQTSRVTLLVPEKLAPLIRRSFPQVTVLTTLNGATLSKLPFDLHCPLGDMLIHALPHYSPASHPPFLIADRDRSQQFKKRYLDLAARHDRSMLVGLAWHTTNDSVGFTRNIALEELHPLLSLADVQFVSLQYGNHEKEIASANRRIPDIVVVDPEIDTLDDLDALAAQIAAMDHVVTIDNATVHLAGSLGSPTTLLLPTVPDWRWGLSAADCRWYGSVRLERQEALFKWKPVVKRLRAHLMEQVGAAA